MVLTIVFAVVSGILIARAKDRLLTVTSLAVGLSILEALLDSTPALPLIVLGVLAFSFYVAFKIDWTGAFIPISRNRH